MSYASSTIIFAPTSRSHSKNHPKFSGKISHDLSSALVGLWRNKCNLKRQNKFKSPLTLSSNLLRNVYVVHLSHAPQEWKRIFYANKWSGNIIIIEFITFLIFFASQYFSFTLLPRFFPKHTTSFHPIKLENFLVFSCFSRFLSVISFFFQYLPLNVCSCAVDDYRENIE